MTNWNGETIRQLERASIRQFVEQASLRGFFRGHVLDFGAGKEPYRDIVQASPGNTGYTAFEPTEYLSGPDYNEICTLDGAFQSVLCTQVVQYLEKPASTLLAIRARMTPAGVLVMTYPTNWDEVEQADRLRYTKAGMTSLLEAVAFDIVLHERRASIDFPGFSFPLGYGVIARRRRDD